MGEELNWSYFLNNGYTGIETNLVRPWIWFAIDKWKINVGGRLFYHVVKLMRFLKADSLCIHKFSRVRYIEQLIAWLVFRQIWWLVELALVHGSIGLLVQRDILVLDKCTSAFARFLRWGELLMISDILETSVMGFETFELRFAKLTLCFLVDGLTAMYRRPNVLAIKSRPSF